MAAYLAKFDAGLISRIFKIERARKKHFDTLLKEAYDVKLLIKRDEAVQNIFLDKIFLINLKNQSLQVKKKRRKRKKKKKINNNNNNNNNTQEGVEKKTYAEAVAQKPSEPTEEQTQSLEIPTISMDKYECTVNYGDYVFKRQMSHRPTLTYFFNKGFKFTNTAPFDMELIKKD